MKHALSTGLMVWTLFVTTAASASDAVFALIVTNNRSFSRARPDLQYADDDGARYHAFFRMVADEEHVSLLTTFDEPTRKLYPDLATQVKRPRKAPLTAEIARIKQQVYNAKAENKRTVFYFVFAGHGYVDRGKGFLELEDGRLGPDDLESAILDQVRADVVHVVLDSCNSFFVINPRKPGGKRWATPRDMTRGFSKRYPHVGVVLSTNSAAEVYEWSEISSGIFSHEIRSGMSGAADANADKMVSYDEIDAFVTTANLGIKNEAYMPKVYIRGPWNNGSTSFLDLRLAKGRQLNLGESKRRIWIRNKAGIRLADLHKEQGARLNLMLPGAAEDSLYIQEETMNKTGRLVLRQYVMPPKTDEAALFLDAFEKDDLGIAARGHDAVFQMVFAHPFGPKAFDTHLKRRQDTPDPIFGISEADKRRMGHYLGALSRSDRQKRFIWGGLCAAEGVVLGIAGAFALTESERDLDEYLFGGISLAASGLLLGLGAYQLFTPSRGEETYETFTKEAAHHPRSEAETIVAKTEVLLEEIKRRERKKRLWTASMMYLSGSASIGAGIFVYVYRDIDWEDRESRGTFATLSCTMGLVSIGIGITMHFIDTPVERMLRLYHEDPDLNVTFAMVPIRSGAATGFAWRF